MQPERTVYLIDGTAYIHRAYHAIQGLTNSSGLPTNAVFGFTRMLIKLMAERAPAYAAMFFDARGPTFRHSIFPSYKANRPPMPADMALQIPYIKEITAGYRLPIFELAGYEADDLIGTLARRLEQEGFAVVMVTGDKDFVQLVTERTSIWDPMKETSTDLASVKEQLGVNPAQMVDVMGLSGDTADNVPGVPGIGPKTALELIREFGSLENLYARIDTIARPKQQEKLLQYKDQAFLSRRLVTIHTDAPVAPDPEALKVKPPDAQILATLFKTLEFRQLQQALPQRADLSRKDYRVILDAGALTDLIARLTAAETVAIDTETTSADPMRAELVGLSFAVQPDEAFYIPCGHFYLGAPRQLDRGDVLQQLKPLLEDPARSKVGQNIKYDWIVLARHGVALDGVVFDTMLASYLLDPSKRAHNLDQIALDFLDHKSISFDEVVGKRKERPTFAQVPLEEAVPYACEDADVTRMAHTVLAQRLGEVGLTGLMLTVEMPLIPVLTRMEMRGVSVDVDRLRGLSKHFEHQLGVLESSICGLAGESFNIHSSQQLGFILFEKLKLPVQKKTKKRTGYSTDVDVLMTLAKLHELPALVLRHRTLAKLKSTYADALIGLVHPQTGRIHTSYHQTVTATGRLSSSDPNLQNIPIRTEEGLESRRAFVPRDGWVLLSADYSQIELRILAHCSADETLIRAFRDEEDIHTRTACEVFQVEPSRVTPELRRQAKAINFGIIYGMSAFGLARQLEISQKMAKVYIDHYFARYPGVQRFLDQTIAEARQTGQTSTLLGRLRRLPDITSANAVVRQAAERTAVNTPIQGSAADLIKVAMIRIDAALSRERFRAAMLLTVHDELVFEVPPEEVGAVARRVAEIMEGVWDLKVPLKVNVATGANWAEAH
ncbi:MAG TPA: DNA polymerase I [Desulfobacterales bacterium]|nr:DNA polymerase I [Desulfobacterales bacterium]